MSAYIVSKGTMDYVVTAIDQAHTPRHHQPAFSGFPLDGDGALNDIGRALFDMNLESVMQRYPDGTKESAPGPCDISNLYENYRHVFRASYNRFCGLKAIRCLLYQSCEGDVPEKSKLYRDLDALANRIATEIVCELPEYSRAPWDCDEAA